jgi:hypothetical protein
MSTDWEIQNANFVANIKLKVENMFPNTGKPAEKALALQHRNAINALLDTIQESEIEKVNIEAQSVKELAQEIALKITPGQGLSKNQKNVLLQAVEDCLADLSYEMPGKDGTVFDELVRNSGQPGSRAKGVPTKIQIAQLPPGVKKAVSESAQRIQTRNKELINSTERYPSTNLVDRGYFSKAVSLNLEGIRSPHTNKSGWLEARAVQEAQYTAIDAAIKERLISKGDRSQRRAHAESGWNHPKVQSIQATPSEISWILTNTWGNEKTIKACWTAYDFTWNGGAGYIEFDVSDEQVSRLVYDYSKSPGRFYISMHYTWHKGMNPWFYVENL